ncbi:asparagine synthetase B [Virgisporangium aliadipatigenens]|uniref:asparagine synthase (glutamine-hydrolyzing) n=1 Tax=Virgisporangium aliadipatigenens TaxID=741659 RepID=A0A8J3YSV6_9ACTN|nr:asparagine synthetase B [Virgisporangium aliadipatigenens]
MRLDGRPASAELAAAMLAASVVPAADRAVHRDGPVAIAGGNPAVDGWMPARATLRAEGAACLDGLLGDWVTAVWDPVDGCLTLARAPLGTHRILVHRTPERILFGTEMGQLRAAGVPMHVDEVVLAEALARAPTTIDETLVRGVRRLPAGELLEIRPGPGTVAQRAFSSLRGIVPPLHGPDLDAAARAVRAALTAAVDAAVPDEGVGVQLSGGVDSSAVLGVACRMPHRSVRVQPISMVFPGRACDETPFIEAVERHLGVRSLRLTPEPYDWDHWRAWAARAVELPVRPNAAMTHTLLRTARAEGLPVMLTGEGGDDWFHGKRYHFADLARTGRWATLWRQSGTARTPRGMRTRLALMWHHGVRPRPGGARPTVPWLRRDRLAGLGLDERWARSAAADASRFCSADHHGRWRPSILRASGPLFDAFRLSVAATGTGWRHPLHDQRVVRAVLGIAGSTLHAPDLTKRVLRAAVAEVLPPPVRARRDKAFFDLEVVLAVEAAGGPAVLRDGPLVRDGWIDPDAVERAWGPVSAAAHAGRRPAPADDHIVHLWELFGLHTFLVSGGITG